uniref:SCAN box domain-containing protein n=1 Tax=Anolis carolinensis TaxID=28377 RepID=A0A803TIC3_ANOCA
MATRLQKKLAGEASEFQGDSSDSEQTPETRETLKYKIELRKLELEDKQREREWEEKRWQLEKDKEIQLKRMELQKANQTEEKERELRMRELELEKERLALSQPHIINQEGNGRTEASVLLLKRFPKFNKDDDVEKFLISFERCCRDFEIDEGKWMLYLRPQICGKLLEIYGNVPEESHRDYNFFKKQVQQKLQLTPEFYRLKFRSLRKEKHQSFSEVASKQAQLFDSWLRTSEVETFQQLRELIKLEQLFQLVPSDYRWLVQDRKPSTADEAAAMTDQVITLREGFKKDEGLVERRQNRPPFYNYQTHTQYKKTPAIENTDYRRPEVINQTKPEVKARCYQCGKSDNLKYQCPLLRRDKTSFFMNKEPKENTVNSDIKLLSSTETVPREKQCLFILSDDFSEDYFEPITIVNQQKQGWRDTGSQVCVIHPKLGSPQLPIKP